jgi:RNA polymerase sigma-70 factor (ECF subfamily)
MPHALRSHNPIATPTTVGDDSSDADLAVRAKTDRRVFALLYGRYVDAIHRHCYRRLSSREAAEDATSQVFTQALAALPRFDERGGSFRGWLFTIANHVLADQFRTARMHRPIEAADDVPDAAPSPEELALAADAGRGLREVLPQLPDQQRRVIELRLAGLTGPEIGRVLGCRAKTVDVAQFRAVARLRVLLGVPARPKGGRDA